jgi:uncharacterized protein (DUF305 family)
MIRATRTTRTGTLVGAGLLAAAVLGGCGGAGAATGPSTDAAAQAGSSAAGGPAGGVAGGSGAAAAAPNSSRPVGPHNATDVAFARGMIPQDVQALASTQIATSKARRAGVKAVATTISTSQVPQIERLSSWLVGWGQPVPAGMIPKGAGKGITQDDLAQLSKATTGFDKLWLTTMIKHQQLVVTLAQAEVRSGSNPTVKALAQKIIKDQQTQLATMKTLLKKA